MYPLLARVYIRYFFIFTQQLENGLIYLALNFVISYYYDKLQSRSNG